MTTTTERSTPRTARLPRRSRRGLIMNLSAAQAITLLVAVLLVAVSIPLFGVGTAFWVGAAGRRAAGRGGVGAPGRVPGGRVGADRLALLAPQVDPAVRVPGHRRTRALPGSSRCPGRRPGC